MKMTHHREPVLSVTWILFIMTLMVVAGMTAWWSWTQTGLGGPWYALIGAGIVAGAFLMFRRRSNN